MSLSLYGDISSTFFHIVIHFVIGFFLNIKEVSFSSRDDEDDDNIFCRSKSTPSLHKRTIHIESKSRATTNKSFLNDELKSISSNDDNEFRLCSKSLKFSNQQRNSSIETLTNKNPLSSPLAQQEDSILIHQIDQRIVPVDNTDEQVIDSKSTLSNDNQLTGTNLSNIQITSTRRTQIYNEQHQLKHHPLTREQRKRIHSRSCTLKQRRRYYRHELIFSNIDHQFTIRRIKSILRQLNIRFYAV